MIIVCMCIFPHHFVFSLFVSLNLICVSYRQDIGKSCFFIQSDNLFHLSSMFSPFTFNVFIDMFAIMSPILLASCLFCFPVPSSLSSLELSKKIPCITLLLFEKKFVSSRDYNIHFDHSLLQNTTNLISGKYKNMTPV